MSSLKLAEILELPLLPEYIKRVNEQLVDVVSTSKSGLKQPLLNIIGGSSKRLRSSLVIASCLGAKIDKQVILGCSAIELTHLASLVHDDVIDDSGSRWSKPTVQNADGQSWAILAGDFLLAQAGLQAAKISTEAAQLVAATTICLADGQALEIAQLRNLNRTTKSYLECISGKTGSLIASACQMGGLCANLGDRQISALGKYGNNLGIAFQIIDDLADILSSQQRLGKTVGNDAKQGVYTLPVLLSLRGSNQSHLRKILDSSSINNRELAHLLVADGSISKTIKQVQKYNALALKSLNDIDSPGLKALPDAYLKWALSSLLARPYQAKLMLNY